MVRLRSGLRPSLHRTINNKNPNRISHNVWIKERGHSTGEVTAEKQAIENVRFWG